jgi:hypothetical protein
VPFQKDILITFLSQIGTYLPYSSLDTSFEFYFCSILIYDAITGYTEFAFERVWLLVNPSRSGVNAKFVSWCADKTLRDGKAELAG